MWWAYIGAAILLVWMLSYSKVVFEIDMAWKSNTFDQKRIFTLVSSSPGVRRIMTNFWVQTIWEQWKKPRLSWTDSPDNVWSRTGNKDSKDLVVIFPGLIGDKLSPTVEKIALEIGNTAQIVVYNRQGGAFRSLNTRPHFRSEELTVEEKYQLEVLMNGKDNIVLIGISWGTRDVIRIHKEGAVKFLLGAPLDIDTLDKVLVSACGGCLFRLMKKYYINQMKKVKEYKYDRRDLSAVNFKQFHKDTTGRVTNWNIDEWWKRLTITDQEIEKNTQFTIWIYAEDDRLVTLNQQQEKMIKLQGNYTRITTNIGGHIGWHMKGDWFYDFLSELVALSLQGGRTDWDISINSCN